MSDYETDDDDNDYLDDGDDAELPDLEQNNNQGNQANPANQANQGNQANQANQADPLFLLNEKKKEFVGSNHAKNNWIQCMFCGVYHPQSMHLPDVAHCGHCWGWVNSSQLDLIQGIYNGPNTIDEVKNFLKSTYPLHPSTCTNQECIYNKIKNFAEAKTLHNDFCVELGFVVENKKVNGIVNNLNNSNNSNNSNKEYKIKKNKGYTRINYKSSSVTI